MLSEKPIFPAILPPYYERVDEPCGWPSGAVTTATPRPLTCMRDLGYKFPTSIARLDDVLVTEPIRIISAEAAAALREAVIRLRHPDEGSQGSAACEVIRAAAYRSALVMSFCLSDELADFVVVEQFLQARVHRILPLCVRREAKVMVSGVQSA